MKKKLIAACIFILMIPVAVFAQTDAEKILSGVIRNYLQVKDYQADIKIVADISFIKILPMNAKLYFKQPDKLKIVSKGIAILPRQGFDQMYKAITDRNSYTVVSQGTEISDGIKTAIISILPLSDTMEVILGKFWIDTEKEVVLKSQMTTRTNGTIIANYAYGKNANYGLPDKMTFIIDVKKFKIPKAVAVDINNYKNEEDAKKKENKKGKIEITLSNYIINKGVDAKIFKE